MLMSIGRFLVKSSGLTDGLFRSLYRRAHDLDHAMEFRANSTRAAFSKQWKEHPEGEYLLTDPWFRENVDRVLSEQEILLKRDWFNGKSVVDAGCGNGRWAYGFSKLGANVTCVDQADSALSAARGAIAGFSNNQAFVKSTLEDLDQKLPPESFDLAFSWGVIHHCVSYNRSLRNVARLVKPGGVIYLYLYGRESLPLAEDIQLFKKRFAYNMLMTDKMRTRFLNRVAGGDPNQVHIQHDIYAPIINRRFTFDEVRTQLESLGFTDVTRTIDHTEVFVRATKGDVDLSQWNLAKKQPPYWFQGHNL